MQTSKTQNLIRVIKTDILKQHKERITRKGNKIITLPSSGNIEITQLEKKVGLSIISQWAERLRYTQKIGCYIKKYVPENYNTA